MKTISMDYDEYVEELNKSLERGFNQGASYQCQLVMEYLDSEKDFSRWVAEELGGESPDCLGWWADLLAFLGRSAEYEEFKLQGEKK